MVISSQAYGEVYEFLGLIDDSYLIKIPKKLREFFKEQKAKNYVFKINKDIPIKDQNLQEDALVIIALLNLEYWCEDDVEKMRLTEIYKRNELLRQQKLQEQYNPNNLFNKDKVEKIVEQIPNTEAAKSESDSKKVLEEIKKLFGS